MAGRAGITRRGRVGRPGSIIAGVPESASACMQAMDTSLPAGARLASTSPTRCDRVVPQRLRRTGTGIGCSMGAAATAATAVMARTVSDRMIHVGISFFVSLNRYAAGTEA